MLTIAIIGRTNVGKSSLFNRFISEAKALVSNIAHTTRDRVTGTTAWRGVELRVIDTGGIEEVKRKKLGVRSIEDEIRLQVERAIGEADALILVVDARDGVLPGERAIARDLRRIGKPILVAWNKSETAKLRAGIGEAATLGLGNAYPTSAVTGMGVGDLLDRIVSLEPIADSRKQAVETDGVLDGLSALGSRLSAIRVAIVGEPNVGKSSILNAILGREEVIVAPEPFTTRDVHDVDLEWFPPQRSASEVDDERTGGRALPGPARGGNERPLRREGGTGGEPGGSPTIITLLDTAGIRRLAVRATRGVRTRIEAIERLAVARSLRAIERADVVCLVLDATLPATRHVKQLADAIVAAGRACVIVVNKMDLVPKLINSSPDQPRRFGRDPDTAERSSGLITSIQHLFPHLSWAPVLATSATDGTNIPTILPTAIRAVTAWRRQLDAHQLAAIHARAKGRIPTARTRHGRKRSHIVELQQVGTAPPRFILISRKRVKLPKAIPAILERAIRESEDFLGSPIRITVKSVKA